MGQGDAPGTDADATDAVGTDSVATDPEGADAEPDEPVASAPSHTDDANGDSDATYRGILGTFPYAFRTTDSLLCWSYVVVGSLVATVIAVLFLVGVVSAFANSLGAVGGTFTFSRTFVFLAGTVVGLPVIGPVVLVARRHRLGHGSIAYDRALAAAGYLYAVSLYLALVISAPPGMRDAPPEAIAPIVEGLYALPQAAGVVPPLLAIAIMYALHRRYR